MQNPATNRTSISPGSLKWLLLTGAALLLLATINPAMADHCKGQHRNDPGCEGGGGGGGGATLDAFTVDDGFCSGPDGDGADAELLGDTRDFEGPGTGYQHCQNTKAGSSVPNNNRTLFTDFQRCIVNMTLPGIGSEILLIKASFNSLRDSAGDIHAVQLFFEDDNGVKYDGGIHPVPFLTAPNASGYLLEIQGVAQVFTQGKGKKDPEDVGTVCIDTVDYAPVP